MMSLKCVSDLYDQDGSVPYASVEDFLAMCEMVFCMTPALTQRNDVWVDEYGTTVLVPA